MAQVFPPGANWLARWSIVLVVVGGGLITAVASAVYWGPAVTQKGVQRNQPVPFSHQRHVQGNGMDCRYCHTSVETSPFAGIPATETCMTCHSQILSDAPMLEPARQSWSTGEPMEWVRVHDLPDFAYFNHSIHVSKGVGCSTCHGDVSDMRLTFKTETMHMRWCIQCHEAPQKFVRPLDQIYNTKWEPPANQTEVGLELVEQYNIKVGQLMNCSICHR